MKHILYALPMALFAAVAVAQTTTVDPATTTGSDAGTSGEMFGTNWPLSVGTTFLNDDNSGTIRPDEELSSGWQSLSQEDRDMVTADCATFMAMHGDTAATTDATGAASGDAAMSGTAPATTEGMATDGTAASGTAAAGSDGSAEGAGYTLAEMKAICEAAEGL